MNVQIRLHYFDVKLIKIVIVIVIDNSIHTMIDYILKG